MGRETWGARQPPSPEWAGKVKPCPGQGHRKLLRRIHVLFGPQPSSDFLQVPANVPPDTVGGAPRKPGFGIGNIPVSQAEL